MEKNKLYPQLEINLKKLESNVKEVVKRCKEQGIQVTGVIKGVNGIPECTEIFVSAGCDCIATSRIEQIEKNKAAGINAPFMMIRVPMVSEAAEIVRLADISLNSELDVLAELNREALKQGKTHEVILMVDLGDLREGFWDQEELISTALIVENEMKGLKLAGIGTNLGCFGSIAATEDKMEKLSESACLIEKKIGRKLSRVSTGGTSSFIRVVEKDMPKGVNQIRIGEGILLGRDLRELWGYDMSFLHQDAFTLKAEVIEVRSKPSHPVGVIAFDAFGNKPVYEDRGTRKRALLGIGKLDYAFLDKIFPREKGIEILGASSDHTILDIEAFAGDMKVGDIVEFDVCYASLIYAISSENVKTVMVRD